tara:strand:+ start:91 stop:708 length:618 start_codon:yes stop_codon:yes gene_type:complete
MTELFTLFPTIIYKSSLSEHQELKKKYVPELIESFKQHPNEKAPWAQYCNTWQDFVDDSNKINQLENAITPHIHEWFNRYNFSSFDYKIRYWFNVHTSNMYQETHDHALGHSVVCGIYYLQLSEKDSPAIFIPHHTFYQVHLSNIGIAYNHKELAGNSKNIVQIKEGDLVLFTPDTKHLVPRAKEEHEGYRISLAFNVEVTSVHP